MPSDKKTPRPIIAAVAASVFVVLYLALGAFSEYWLGVVTTHPIGDDFKIYHGALLKANVGQNPYEPYSIGGSFIYHPFALTFVSLFSWVGDRWTATYLWMAASLLAWAAAIWLAGRIAQSHLRLTSLFPNEAAEFYFVTLIFLGFAPFWETIHIGQINTFVILALLLAFYLAEKDRPWLVGIALALAVVFKTSPLLFVFYFLALRKFRVVASATMALAAFSVIASLQFSPRVFVEFFAILPRLGLEIHPDPYNQSLLGILFRTAEFLDPKALGSSFAVSYRMLSAIVYGILLVTGLWIYREAVTRRGWLFALLLALMVFASPLVWYHHSTLLLLPLATLILHPSPRMFASGVVLLLLIQSERLFEHFVTRTAFPTLAAHILLIGILATAYFKHRLNR